MKQLLVVGISLVLLFACGKSKTISDNVPPGWTKFGGNTEGMTLYVESATISRNGDIVAMWHIYDNRAAETLADVNKQYMSIKGQDEYSCGERQSRVIATSFYADNMAKGELVYSDVNPSKWAPVAPGSVSEALLKKACDEK
jgi:hypothetical protein